MDIRSLLRCGLGFALAAFGTLVGAAGPGTAEYAARLAAAADAPKQEFPALDMERIAREDALADFKGTPGGFRFAIGRDVDITPLDHGAWERTASGGWIWRLKVETPDAVHLNFGFSRFKLPPSARLLIISADGRTALGPFTAEQQSPTGQLWTQVLDGSAALLELSVADGEQDQVELRLARVGQGYRGFGYRSKHCKSGACNMDVACLGDGDPWNAPRRSAGAITIGGTDTCSGSLVNNSNNNRRMLFATATHCGLNSGNIASVLVYWNYEAPTCRAPGSTASGTPTPRPGTTSAGLAFIAATESPFGGGTAGPRSDWTLVELAGTPNPAWNLHWAGWDRRATPAVCAAPVDPAATTGLCATIHHPSVDEKRITFVQQNFEVGNISGGVGVHWHAFWDPTPPALPNIPPPVPNPIPPGVTEPGSSGSPLYTAQQRLAGVLSGGPSACGSTGANLSDFYGALFHAWDGVAGSTPATRMRDHLDPANTGAETLDGINQCNAPAIPVGIDAVASAANRITVGWGAVTGAERYRVYRSSGACPGSAYAQIAEVAAPTTTYDDNTVSGGSVYSYAVTSFDDTEACESVRSSCDSDTATGVCSLAPTFAGLSTAASAATAACAINLGWQAAGGNCGAGSNLAYNVYRDTTSGFVPAAANRIDTCGTATSFTDTSVTSGTRYYYVVRAEDQGASGGGGACGGVQDGNAVERNAQPTGPSNGFAVDNVEGTTDNFVVSGTGNVGANFVVSTLQARSPTHSWFAIDPANLSDRRLTYAAAIPVPAANPGSLNFWHRYDTEASSGTPTLGYDGGVLEYSLDGGVTWSDILAAQGPVPANAARLTAGGYNRTISTGFASALGGRQAWSGDSSAFVQTSVNLADFAGRSVTFRFRFASDNSVGDTGWFIDDIDAVSFGTCGVPLPDDLFRNGFEDPPPPP